MCPIVPPDGRPAGDSPDTAVPAAEFAQLVRGALGHVYDYSYLQSHPLATLLSSAHDYDQVSRAQRLRHALLDCIEGLKPAGQGDMVAERARSYALLTSRYLDGMGVEEVAKELGLSRRHAFRELDKGVRAVASLLWDRIHCMGKADEAGDLPEPGVPSDRAEMARTEVERLRQNLHPENLDVGQLLEGVLAVAVPLAQKRGVQIGIRPRGQNLSIYADRVMVRQALLTLVSQALDAVGGPELIVQTASRQGGVLLDIRRVTDAARLRLAEPSSDGQSPVELSVAQRLIQAQGGRLWVHHAPAGWAARAFLPSTHRPVILVIDDNADLVALFQRYLAAREVALVGATDGAKALRLAEELQPQLIILDLMMPNQDGWEILRQINASAETKDIPIIICSVLNEREMALASGANDYLVKPVNQVDLLTVLRRWLGTLRPTV